MARRGRKSSGGLIAPVKAFSVRDTLARAGKIPPSAVHGNKWKFQTVGGRRVIDMGRRVGAGYSHGRYLP